MKRSRPDYQVVKFGGSAFLELADYRRIAAALVQRLAAGDTTRLVVVVSGMSGTTGKLLEAATQIDPALEPAVQDEVLATAEMVSSSFLRAALHAEGCPSLDLWAPQLGFRSDSLATRARIVDIDPRPAVEALRMHRVVVVAGGQAVDPGGRITMLGRNSSDLTAVAMAAALGARRCEIFSDVAGVYTADPYVVPSARLLANLSYRQCAAMSASGAKVLHWGSVRYAESHGVEIVCRAVDDVSAGDSCTRPSTVGGAGGGSTTVVGDRRAQIYATDRPVSAGSLGALRDGGLTVVRAGGEAGSVLAFTGNEVGVAEALERASLKAARLEDAALLSTVRPDGEAHRRVVRAEDIDAEVCALHDDLYGQDPPAADQPARTKRRSAHSGLLAGTLAS